MKKMVFSERFNLELMSLNLPDDPSDKSKAVAKGFGISPHLANALILGHLSPSVVQLNSIAKVLEVSSTWLSGDSDKKKVDVRRESTETVA